MSLLLVHLLDHLHDEMQIDLTGLGGAGHVLPRAVHIERFQVARLGLCQGREGMIQVFGGIALVCVQVHFLDQVLQCQTYRVEVNQCARC